VQELNSYYKNEGDTYLIEIRLSNVSQIFNSFDPSPFLEKDLDEDAESYTALTAAMRYILKSESFDRRGQGEKLYCIIAGSAVLFSL
jgi:hypothetical protein